ncbi:MAG TPA: M4 family metallopeptidase [Thermoanaerobaculia bacterium]|nr:M4 family metallopeptidase [Thermoanaerobaculia bacterium]
MKNRILLHGGIAVLAALSVHAPLHAQMSPRTIPSLTEPGEGLAIRDVSPQTGLVTFAGSPSSGHGILLGGDAKGASAEARAMSFVASYGRAFGLTNASQVRMLRASKPDAAGMEHVRLQQVHRGVPVRAAELVVHMKGARVLAANGHTVSDLPENLLPRIDASGAKLAAQRLLEKHFPQQVRGATYSDARLEIFNRSLVDSGKYPSRLAWFVEAKGPELREFLWVDAENGNVLLHFNQVAHAKLRYIYTANHTDTKPGTLVRSEGEAATGDADQDNAYTFAGITYDYYFNNHGRDSFDSFGANLVSTAHYCPAYSCPSYANAFWDGAQMVYGDGFASADDVVGHELTHAVTEYTAGLLYYNQSGALNESFSDIFGETIDLTDGTGNDNANVRWKLGEDLSIGAIRDMSDPTVFGDPGKLTDANFYCNEQAWTDPYGDSGGVHINSGIPNHAYALMVDGGTYNLRTVTGIGLTKAAKIQYRALTEYLVSGSGFLDDYNALNQSCADLIGTAGISAADCTAVNEALLAVEMNETWPCAGFTDTPAMCPSGIPSFLKFEGFENNTNLFTAENDYGTWSVTTGGAREGIVSEWGRDADGLSDHRLMLTDAVTIPATGRMYFDHMFEFETGGGNWDGGVLEYSTNGVTWLDAASLIDGGQNYAGTVETGYANPLATRSAFVGSSFGYTGTRLNLTTLVGQSVRFRFRVGSDISFGSLGWLVDNVSLYTCVPSAFTDDPLVAVTTAIKKAHIEELRKRIDSIRIRSGLTAFTWTDPTLTSGTTLVKSVHVSELRSALDAAYTARYLTLPSYTDPTLTTSTPVKGLHLTQLRLAVIALE